MGLNVKLDQQSQAGRIYLDYFVYSTVFNVLGAGGVITQQVPITADSDFVLDALNLVAYSAVGILVVNPDYQLSLVDTGSGRNLQDAPIHVNNITGTGQFPYILPECKIFAGSSNISITLQNNTAVAAKVDIALIGRKCFYRQGFSRSDLLAGFF